MDTRRGSTQMLIHDVVANTDVDNMVEKELFHGIQRQVIPIGQRRRQKMDWQPCERRQRQTSPAATTRSSWGCDVSVGDLIIQLQQLQTASSLSSSSSSLAFGLSRHQSVCFPIYHEVCVTLSPEAHAPDTNTERV